MAELHLNHSRTLSKEDIRNVWPQWVRIRAGKDPELNLQHIPLTIIEKEQQSSGWGKTMTSFDVKVGLMTVEVKMEFSPKKIH